MKCHGHRAPGSSVPRSVQALDGDCAHGNGVAVFHRRSSALDSVHLSPDDFETGNLARDGIVPSRVVVVLVGREHFGDGHTLFVGCFEHLQRAESSGG